MKKYFFRICWNATFQHLWKQDALRKFHNEICTVPKSLLPFLFCFLFGLFVLWKIPTNCGLDSEIKFVSLSQPFSMNLLFTKNGFHPILAVFFGKCLFSLENSDGEKKKKSVSPPWLLWLIHCLPSMCMTLRWWLVRRNESSSLLKTENKKQLQENHILRKEMSPF